MSENGAVYDAIIVGAGPAGFTAGLYLASFGLKTLLLDTLAVLPEEFEPHSARSLVPGMYWNVPGFPQGIERHDLKWRGISQAQNLGCDYKMDEVLSLTSKGSFFEVTCKNAHYQGKSLFLAMGVQDDWPLQLGLERFIGTSLFWSAESNLRDAEGKSVAVIGHQEVAARSALQLQGVAKQVALITQGQLLQCSEALHAALRVVSIPIYTERISAILTNMEAFEGLTLENLEKIPAQVVYYTEQSRVGRSEIAKPLGVVTLPNGLIPVNTSYETNMANVYAIGDITGPQHEQAITSFYQGMEAAWAYYQKRIDETIQMLAHQPVS